LKGLACLNWGLKTGVCRQEPLVSSDIMLIVIIRDSQTLPRLTYQRYFSKFNLFQGVL
jgi:hypothetical protein